MARRRLSVNSIDQDDAQQIGCVPRSDLHTDVLTVDFYGAGRYAQFGRYFLGGFPPNNMFQDLDFPLRKTQLFCPLYPKTVYIHHCPQLGQKGKVSLEGQC